MKLEPFTNRVRKKQEVLGFARPRLYTRAEAAEELEMTVPQVSGLINEYNIQPAFLDRKPQKFRLADIKRAVNTAAEKTVYKIEKNIPVTPRWKKGSSERSELLLSMAPLDSLVAPKPQVAVLAQTARKMGIKVTTRSVDKDNARLWRLE